MLLRCNVMMVSRWLALLPELELRLLINLAWLGLFGMDVWFPCYRLAHDRTCLHNSLRPVHNVTETRDHSDKDSDKDTIVLALITANIHPASCNTCMAVQEEKVGRKTKWIKKIALPHNCLIIARTDFK